MAASKLIRGNSSLVACCCAVFVSWLSSTPPLLHVRPGGRATMTKCVRWVVDCRLHLNEFVGATQMAFPMISAFGAFTIQSSPEKLHDMYATIYLRGVSARKRPQFTVDCHWFLRRYQFELEEVNTNHQQEMQDILLDAANKIKRFKEQLASKQGQLDMESQVRRGPLWQGRMYLFDIFP